MTFLAGTGAAPAQEAKDIQFVNAAFRCAILAAESSEVSGHRARASELALKALPKALAISKLQAAGMRSGAADNGPLGAFIAAVPDDFFAPLYFAAAQTEIGALLPQAGKEPGTYEEFKLHKETMADIEYGNRNCDLIGL